MNEKETFQWVAPVIFGCGVSQRLGIELKAKGCTKVLLLHGKSVGASGVPARLIKNIEEAGLAAVPCDQVEPDPSDSMIDRVAAMARREGVDGIVAVGGGSCIDAAKGIKLLLNNGGCISDFFDLAKPQKNGVPLVAIPTTSGTGSESTRVCVVTDTKAGAKRVVFGPGATPDLALVDPELTVTTPARTTAACGFDVLSHAIDAATSLYTNEITQTVAHHTIELVRDNLKAAYEDGGNMEARVGMHLAADLGGVSIANGNCSMSHAFAHALGAAYHISHGVCCAVFTPATLEYIADQRQEEIRRIGGLLGVSFAAGDDNSSAARKVSEKIYRMYRELNIPNIAEIAPDEEAARAKIKPLAMADIDARFCPRPLDDAGADWILERTYEMSKLG